MKIKKHISIDESLYNEVMQLAQDTDRPFSYYINKSVALYLDAVKKQRQ